MANYKQKDKYNIQEVRITRCVIGMFLYALMAVSVWGVRRLHLIAVKETGYHFVIFAVTGLMWLLAGIAIVLYRRKKKAGGSFGHRVWGVEYVVMLLTSLASALSVLAVSYPPEMWGYTTPVAYTLVAVLYVLYVVAWDQGKNFRFFGILCAVAGVGGMLMCQTYYVKQIFLQPAFRVLDSKDAFLLGWGIIAVALIGMAVMKKKGTSVWKQASVVVLFALYWLALQLQWWSAANLTIILGSVMTLWFVILRILRQIKVIK